MVDTYDLYEPLKALVWDQVSDDTRDWFVREWEANEPDEAVITLVCAALAHGIDTPLIAEAYKCLEDEDQELLDEHYDLGNRLRAESKI